MKLINKIVSDNCSSCQRGIEAPCRYAQKMEGSQYACFCCYPAVHCRFLTACHSLYHRDGQKEKPSSQSLRLWLLQNYKGEIPLLDLWDWLKEGLHENDINLRKYLIQSGNRGLFSSPQEMLEWIKTGAIPRSCQKVGKT